jgi:DNA-binding NarL/FixJ family response regulator
LPETKVIIFTDFPKEVPLKEAVKAGASGFLTKEEAQDPEMLVKAIHTVHQGQNYLTPAVATKAMDEISGLLNPLTDREIQVLKLIEQGLGNRKISHRLNIAESTVANRDAEPIPAKSRSSKFR